MGRRGSSSRFQFAVAAAALIVIVVVQMAIANDGGGQRATASAKLTKKVKALSRRVGQLEAQVKGPAGGDLSGNYPNPSIAPGAVNSAKVADQSLTGSDIDEATLEGVLRFSGSIPSGVTVRGGWALTDSGTGGNDIGLDAVTFPLPAPTALTNTTVNFAGSAPSSTVAADDDATCAGSDTNPTAPAGKVCLYAASGGAAANTLTGGALTTSGSINGTGFRVVGDGAGTADVSGTWAYTAP